MNRHEQFSHTPEDHNPENKPTDQRLPFPVDNIDSILLRYQRLKLKNIEKFIDKDSLLDLMKEQTIKIRSTIAEVALEKLLLSTFLLERVFEPGYNYFLLNYLIEVGHTGSITVSTKDKSENLFEIDSLLFDPLSNSFLIIEVKVGEGKQLLETKRMGFGHKRVRKIMTFLLELKPLVPVTNYLWLHAYTPNIWPEEKKTHVDNHIYTNHVIHLPYSLEELTALAEEVKVTYSKLQ